MRSPSRRLDYDRQTILFHAQPVRPIVRPAAEPVAFFREITVTCFFSSYTVVLGLECLRLAGKIPGRAVAVIGMTTAGLIAHIAFVVLRAMSRPAGAGVLASWFDAGLLVALGLAIAFVWVYIRRPETIVGLFFLPAVLATIAGAWSVRSWPPFSSGRAFEIWRSIHGGGMMIGAAVVCAGFLAALMFWIQSWRLKNHRVGSRLRLPTLETSLRWTRNCLTAGTIAVAAGWIAGVVMNLNRWGYVGWTDRGVLLSTGLLVWLVVATILDRAGGYARTGRRATVATLAGGGFLLLAVVAVLSTTHGAAP